MLHCVDANTAPGGTRGEGVEVDPDILGRLRLARSVRFGGRKVDGAPKRSGGHGTILVAGPHVIGRPVRMGAKYLPTIKDQKASQRFQQKQKPLRKFKKNGGATSVKKGK